MQFLNIDTAPLSKGAAWPVVYFQYFGPVMGPPIQRMVQSYMEAIWPNTLWIKYQIITTVWDTLRSTLQS